VADEVAEVELDGALRTAGQMTEMLDCYFGVIINSLDYQYHRIQFPLLEMVFLTDFLKQGDDTLQVGFLTDFGRSQRFDWLDLGHMGYLVGQGTGT